jgi:putative transposase
VIEYRDAEGKPERLPALAAELVALKVDVHAFFGWYNTEHHHSGLGLLTPADVHHGLADQRAAARAAVLAAARVAHPERFPAGLPHPPAHPSEVWINPPKRPLPSQTASALCSPSSPALANAAAFA